MQRPVLLPEDEPFIALDLKGILNEDSFYDVVALKTRTAALEWLGHRPLLAIVDPRLSDGLCGDVVRELVERDIPFIVYSGDPGPPAKEAPAFGVGKHLPKPCPPAKLMAAIESALLEHFLT